MDVIESYFNGVNARQIAKDIGLKYSEVNKIIDDHLVEQYTNGTSIKQLSKLTKKSKNTISNKLKKYIITRQSKGSKRLSDSDKINIRKLATVNGLSISEISKMINSSWITVSNYIKKNNIVAAQPKKVKQIPNRHKYFTSNILSHSESYILGYISGDGHVSNENGIQIFSTDEEIINKLKLFLYNFSLYSQATTHKRLYILNSRLNRQLIDKFHEYGLYNDKSYSIRYPKHIELEFDAYLRGLFDADGHISKQKYNGSNGILVGITAGSKEFLQDIIEQIKFYLPNITRHTISVGKAKNSTWYQLRYYSKNAKMFLEFMYKNKNGLFMKRKYDRYLLYTGHIKSQVK